jgi:hypothetical protein
MAAHCCYSWWNQWYNTFVSKAHKVMTTPGVMLPLKCCYGFPLQSHGDTVWCPWCASEEALLAWELICLGQSSLLMANGLIVLLCSFQAYSLKIGSVWKLSITRQSDKGLGFFREVYGSIYYLNCFGYKL